MLKRSWLNARRSVLIGLLAIGFVVAATVLPEPYKSSAAVKTGSGLFTRTISADPLIPNFDIRVARTESADDPARGVAIEDFFASSRASVGRNAVDVANIRESFVRGEETLRTSLPTVKVEYNADIRIPEVITPDVWQDDPEFLTRPSSEKRSEILRSFVARNNELVGITDGQAGSLKVTADYKNPDGNLSYAHLEQFINGVPVFRGEVKAGFAADGRMVRVINNLAAGLEYASLPNAFGNPAEAVRAAAGHIEHEMRAGDTAFNKAESTGLKAVFGSGDQATTAEKMYFPTEPGIAVPAWRVLIWQQVSAYYVIVDAASGTMLWRKNITEDQTQTATYNVYANSNSFYDTAESPAPITPGPNAPNTGVQGAQIARQDRTLIGNEAPNLGQNNLGWMTDGTNFTDGNNVEAGLDIDGFDGVDAPLPGTNRVFSFAYNPPPGMPPPPDALTTVNSRSGAITHLFYTTNRYHDYLYSLGFTEAARNFQNNNFGRGGFGFDRVRAEAQDSSGTDNANFSTPADGGRGRMQMYVFTQIPGRDGSLDTDIVVHELTHGTSNRLHGNGGGLGTTRARGMGEGWSDFYPLAGLAEETDPASGIYAAGAYATFNVFGIGSTNAYYGIRRFPYAVFSATGGPLNRPHNPLTAADVNVGCNVTDGAFGASPPFNGACDEVHNQGEVWASFLWEARARFIARLGFAVGNRKQLQLVTDGMKLAPLNPTMVQERDAIIASALASSFAPDAAIDAADFREGFRLRGLGFAATDNSITIVESFLQPTAVLTTPFSVSDSTGDNDGFPEPGENVLLNITVRNPTNTTLTNVTVNVADGGTVNYGTIGPNATAAGQVPYTVPAATACGALQNITINVSSDGITQIPAQQVFRVGVPGPAFTFSNTAAITIPAGAPATSNGPATPYPSGIVASGVSGPRTIKVVLNQLSHTNPADLDMLLVGPGGQKFVIFSDQGDVNDINAATITLFDAALNSLPAIIVTGDYKPTANSGQDSFPAPAPGPIYQLPAPGGSVTFASLFGTNGANMNGTWNLFIVDDTVGGVGQIAGGWSISFESSEFVCALGTPTPTPTGTPSPTPTNTPTATPTATPCPPFFVENFDGVTQPALPAGWVAVNAVGPDPLWVTSPIGPDTPPNAAYIDDAAVVSDKRLDSPSIAINSASAQLSFRNSFNTEFSDGTFWDGGVLEVSSPNINGGAFTDITNAAVGGSFVSGGYTGTLDGAASNPLANRMAWSGNSNGYINTVVNLGANVNGQTIKFRFRMGTDVAEPGNGWFIDTLSVSSLTGCSTPTPTTTPTNTPTATPTNTPTATPTNTPTATPTNTPTATPTNTPTATPTNTPTATPTSTPTATPTPSTLKSRADFDADGRTDLSVFRNSDATFYINRSRDGQLIHQFGLPGDIPVPGDYDADGATDIAVFRPDMDAADVDYYVLNSSTGTVTYQVWGLPGDTPIAGDFDGDGRADYALYRQSETVFYILNSSGGFTAAQFGTAGDIPMGLDFDGDGITNRAVFRSSNQTWYIGAQTGTPSTNFTAIVFGLSGDAPVPADYDGNQADNLAVFRNGVWHVRSAAGAVSVTQFGLSGDTPVPGDYDGDGTDDIAVFRAGTWYILNSNGGTLSQSTFGSTSDTPLAKKYIP